MDPALAGAAARLSYLIANLNDTHEVLQYIVKRARERIASDNREYDSAVLSEIAVQADEAANDIANHLRQVKE